MAKKDNSILGKLNTEKVSRAEAATAAREAAEYHRSQIAANEAVADLSDKQVAAISKAQAILSEAGINF